MSSILSQLNFSGRRRLPAIRQTEAAECGLACLAMVAGYHGHEIDLNTLRRRYPVSLKGASLKAIMTTADHLDLATRALRVELEALDRLALPAILHWDLNHFVVLKSVRGKMIEIHDPARGERRMTLAEASPHFTGVALELTPTTAFEQREEVSRMKLTDLWSRSAGIGRAILQTLILSALLQIVALGMPFYMQVVVDEVLTKFDTDLLLVLALGFGMLVLIDTVTKLLRDYVILYVGNQLSFQMVSNLFRHLMVLPLPWFEKRHIGDIVSRFSSTQPIRDLFTEGIVSALIDGVMAIATLVLIFVYSVTLGFVVVGAATLYLILRVALYRPLRNRNEDQIVAQAKEQSIFMESVRGIQSVKLFGRETERQSVWQNKFADNINAKVRLGKLQIGFDAANTLLFGLENVLVIYLGAQAVIAGELTIGMLFAFMAYKRNFIDKASALVERFIEFRILDLHLERIADIGHAEPEGGRDMPETPLKDASGEDTGFKGRIALNDVSFRYAEGEPWVLRHVSLHIEPGEMVVFAGPSGQGKTTLLKVMLGLFTTEEGELLIDDQPLDRFGRRRYRSKLGAVMQEDALLSGSIADNISFFDPEQDMAQIQFCAQQAFIHADIAAMPMGYDSLIGDMGTVLSGGQKQRVLLARALYRSPQILFLDEGTANLDPATERAVLGVLGDMTVTRICVAHRAAMIDCADRIYLVQGGQVREVARDEAMGASGLPPETSPVFIPPPTDGTQD